MRYSFRNQSAPTVSTVLARLSPAAFGTAALLLAAGAANAGPTTCSTVAACVMGTNTTGGPGVGGTSSSGFGVSGISKSGHGVNGTSASSFGVVGITTENATSGSTARAGVVGEDASTNKKAYNSGVAGTSAYGYGGSFTSTNGIGLYASSASLGGTTVVGGTDGMDVTPSGGIGGFNGNSNDSAIRAYANNGWSFDDNLFVGVECFSDPDNPTESCSDVVSIDSEGNAIFAGTLTQNGTPLVRTRSSSGVDVASFGARSASPTLEDFGKAELRNGVAYVALDSTFASTIDRSGYMVFVTPEGDSNSLYTRLATNGFTVRESKAGRSSLTFDYRIVAKPLDAKSAHLPSMKAVPQLAQHVKISPNLLARNRNRSAN